MMPSDFNNALIPKDFELSFPIKQDQILDNGKLVDFKGAFTSIYSPIKVSNKNFHLGEIPNMKAKQAKKIVSASHSAFNHGLGAWPSLSPEDRISAIQKLLELLQPKREEIAKLIMWEIGKTYKDCLKEFDRTIDFIKDSITSYRSMLNKTVEEPYKINIRPFGVVFCLGPYNFPFNETLSLIIPALLIGNTVILKPAKFGALLLRPLLPIFEKILPKNTVLILYSNNKKTVKQIIKSGKVNVLALIGNSRTAQKLQKLKPKKQLLRKVFSLEAKNPAIVFPDCNIEETIEACMLGSLAFNGQRCTALKALFIHHDILDTFITKFCERVAKLKSGLPWEKDVLLTPLPPDNKKFKYLCKLIEDAKLKGAKIVNKYGGKVNGNFMSPTILSPVNPTMKIFHEEQFGPIVPIIPFTNESGLIKLLKLSEYGQQASLFSSMEKQERLVQFLEHQFGRVNFNKLCQRGPDTLPFSGRKNSASFSLGVENTLRCFSIEVVMA